MPEQESFFDFFLQQSGKIWQQTLEHIGITFLSLLIAVLVGMPLGIMITRHKKLAGPLLGFAGILQTIPSIALLGFLIPLFGIGAKPAVFALFLYSLLPIIRNTYTGVSNVDSAVKESAVAMGLNKWQVLFNVELPLAMPVLLAGIRTATVINVGVATLAAYIAAGGLGEFIFGGIALNNSNMILAGAIPAALLAIVLDLLLSRVQHLNFKKLKAAFYIIPVVIIIMSSFYLLPAVNKGKLLAGFTPEFMGRRDGNIGLKEKYGLNIRTVVISDAVMYKAAFEKKLDVISGYSTDGRLKAFDLVVLNDDKTVFPPYYAAPVVRRAVLKQHPELEQVLNLLAGRINDSVMTDLNYKVDYLKESPQKVAKDFLVKQGLWRQPRNGTKGIIRIGSKIFAEQYTLSSMYAMLISGYTDLGVETKTGLGGTKICFDALTNNRIDLYPEYTGTGLLVILKPSSKQADALMASKDSVYNYVKLHFEDQYDVTWLKPVGFNNAYALMMRRKQSDQLHVKSISDLALFLENK